MTTKTKKPVTPKKIGKLHVKPTQEELDANAMKALEEAKAIKEKLKDQPKLKKESKQPEPKVEPKPKQPEKEPKPKPESKPSFKKRFIASTKEAQILHARNKTITSSIEKAMSVPEPTEEELKVKYSDWEVMSDFEKKMARDSLRSTRRFQALEGIAKENKNLEAWQKKVDKFVDDPQTLIDIPKLEGKGDEFKLFATKPTRRNMDFGDIVKAFLYDATETPEPKKKKGSMFETGTGGPTTKDKLKSNKISFEDGQALKENDYSKYVKLLKANKIEEVDL